jgi:hypothetical protein
MCLAMLLALNKDLPSNFIFCKLGRPSTKGKAIKKIYFPNNMLQKCSFDTQQQIVLAENIVFMF